MKATLKSASLIQYKEFPLSLMEKVINDGYFIVDVLIDSVHILGSEHRILGGKLSHIISSDYNKLELLNTKGESVFIYDNESTLSIHLLQRQLFFHILNLKAWQLSIHIDLKDGCFRFFPYREEQAIVYDFVNIELPISDKKRVKRTIEIWRDNKQFKIGLKNDVAIMLCYNAFNSGAYTSHHETRSLLHTEFARGIHLKEEERNYHIYIEYRDGKFIDPLLHGIGDAISNETIVNLFEMIVETLHADERYILPVYMTVDGSIIKHPW